MSETYRKAQKQALVFLAHGPHAMLKAIADEGQMCAALVFSDLERDEIGRAHV